MTYTKKDDTVRLEMTHADYTVLLYLMGQAVWEIDQYRKEHFSDTFFAAVAFVDSLNEGNPEYVPIPAPRNDGDGARYRPALQAQADEYLADLIRKATLEKLQKESCPAYGRSVYPENAIRAVIKADQTKREAEEREDR